MRVLHARERRPGGGAGRGREWQKGEDGGTPPHASAGAPRKAREDRRRKSAFGLTALKGLVPARGAKAKAKAKAKAGEASPSKSAKPSVAVLRRQSRSLRRLLARMERSGDAGAAAGAAAVRGRVAQADRAVEDALRSSRERKITLRYKRIRIFERVKLTRMLKRIVRRQREEGARADGAAGPPDLESFRTKIESDLEYVRFFPKGTKYVSLFRNNYRDYRAMGLRAADEEGEAPPERAEEGAEGEARAEIDRLKALIERKRALARPRRGDAGADEDSEDADGDDGDHGEDDDDSGDGSEGEGERERERGAHDGRASGAPEPADGRGRERAAPRPAGRAPPDGAASNAAAMRVIDEELDGVLEDGDRPVFATSRRKAVRFDPAAAEGSPPHRDGPEDGGADGGDEDVEDDFFLTGDEYVETEDGMKIHVRKADGLDADGRREAPAARGTKRGRHDDGGARDAPRGRSKLTTRRDARAAAGAKGRAEKGRAEKEAPQRRTRAEGGRKRRKKSKAVQ